MISTLVATACTAPDDIELTTESLDLSFATAAGYQRQIVGVTGDTLLASAVLDPGTTDELVLASPALGARFFQIPVDTTPGNHPVALRNAQGESDPVDLDVLDLPDDVWPAPRVEDIGVLFSTPGPGEDLLLTVAAANLDMDSTVEVRVGGVALTVSTDVPWSAIPILDQLTHDPTTFGYPVFHYLQRLILVENTNPGDELEITVTNTLDGQADSTTWTVPEAADLDSDGDGLLDSYDGGIYTAPSGATIDLGAMGTSKYHKDILIEADWIADAAPPAATDWTVLEDAFAAAPVLSPGGGRGINVIIDRGQSAILANGGTVLPDHTTIDFNASGASTTVDFYDVKADPANFDPDRLEIFHYLILGRARPNGSSGRGEVIGNDLLVSMVQFSNYSAQFPRVSTMMHELGHNLGLRHGGHTGSGSDENETRKPNLSSVMGYHWQFPGADIDCDYSGDASLRFSEGDKAALDESAGSEPDGICDAIAVDLNEDGDANDTGAFTMNPDNDTDTNDVHEDADQWGNLRLAFVTDPDSDWDND